MVNEIFAFTILSFSHEGAGDGGAYSLYLY